MLPPEAGSVLHRGCSHIVPSMGPILALLGEECCPNSPQEPSLSQCELLQAATSGGGLLCRDWK